MSKILVIIYSANGKISLTKEEWNKFDPQSVIYHREDGPALEAIGVYKRWYINGKHHREDGPAIEYADGVRIWFKDGKQHREDGPSLYNINGGSTAQWIVDGKHHREDGPAIEYAGGDKTWYINGERFFEKDFHKIIKEVDSLDPALGLTDPREWVRKRFSKKYKKTI